MSLQPTQFRAHGKLLLSGEYFVLDGALALALPLLRGQTMLVRAGAEPGRIHWVSCQEDGAPWFEAHFSLPGLHCESGSDEAVARRLETILRTAATHRPDLLDPLPGLRVECRLDFPRQWGLGTSSTLISLIAQWSGADPFDLLAASFGGSGYDLACATATGPLLYQRRPDRPHFVEAPFAPPFHPALFFAYLGRKQDSRDGIARYRERVARQPGLIDRVSRLTTALLCAADLDAFERAIAEHERVVADAVALPRAKEQHFPDFWGEVKSLGAWGGDFVLLTSRRGEDATREYLAGRGYEVLFRYDQLVRTK